MNQRGDDVLPILREPVERGATWTTDAPFREMATAIKAARSAASLRSRWSPPLSTLSRRRGGTRSFASPTYEPDGPDRGRL
jgi:hypothetical protein